VELQFIALMTRNQSEIFKNFKAERSLGELDKFRKIIGYQPDLSLFRRNRIGKMWNDQNTWMMKKEKSF